MSPDVQDPDLDQDIAAFFGATASTPDTASPDAGRDRADEAAQADVQDDVNDYFGVEGS